MINIGLVLSGGMVKGAYQIGALQAIKEFFKHDTVCCVSASSIGVLNAYSYLTDGLHKATELWKESANKKQRNFATDILKNGILQSSIVNILSDVEINNPFYISLVDIKKRQLIYVDLGKVGLESLKYYLQASVSLPFFNQAVKIRNNFFYDGGIVDNIPVYPILKHKIDYIICIYFDKHNFIFENDYIDNKIIKINFSDNKLISSSICFTESSIEHMLDEGYVKAKSILKCIFQNGTEDSSYINSRINDLNSLNTNRSIRITGDILVNNMNKISRKFLKKTEIF